MKRISTSNLLVASTWLLFMPATVQAGLYPGLSNLNHTCSLVKPTLSCSPNAIPSKSDSCCVETYGGLVLSTQFWSTYTNLESTSQLLPPSSWTLHGLWPDFCNGSYPGYCDLTRQYDPSPDPSASIPPYTGPAISTFLTALGKLDLLSWMNTFWIAQNQPNPSFWAHEFSKHATCFSTYDVECYGPAYVPHSEVVDFFEASIMYFNQLPTFEWLAEAGIRPTNSTGYTFEKIQRALGRGFGATPYIACSGARYNETEKGKGSKDDGKTQLSEVWYYHHAYGATQNGRGKAVDADINGGKVTNCAKAKGAVRYPLRGKGSERR